jgi:hypothetical protein
MSNFEPIEHNGRTWLVKPDDLAELVRQVWPGAHTAGMCDLLDVSRETVRRYMLDVTEPRALPLPPAKLQTIIEYIDERARTMSALREALEDVQGNLTALQDRLKAG